jgi:hypothetical protein
MATPTDARHATLKLSKGPEGQVLTASVPHDVTEKDLAVVTKSAFALVSTLHHCNCLSGVIKLVVEDNFADAIQVDLAAH